MNETLGDILERYKQDTLLAILIYNGINVVGKRGKQYIIPPLVERFSQPGHVQKTLPKLGASAREAVNHILRQGGRASLFSIQHWLESNKLVTVSNERSPLSSYNSSPSHRNPQSRDLGEIMASLAVFGLVFACPKKDQNAPGQPFDFNLAQEYFIPPVLIKNFPAPPAPTQWQPKYTGEPVQIAEGSARVFQRDLYLYWTYVERNQVELTAKGLIAKRYLVALNNSLLNKQTISTGQVETDFLRLVFMRGLLTELGMLKVNGQILQARPAGEFLALNPAERIQRCLEVYTACRGLNELLWFLRVIPISYDTPTLPAPDALVDARRSVLHFLKPATRWIQLDSIIKNIQLNRYEFLLPRGYRQNRAYYVPPHPYSAYTNPLEWDFPGITQDASGWETVEAGFIRNMVHGPLHWMGLVDLGTSDKKQTRPDIFRLTPVGAWLLAGAPAPEIPLAGGQVIIQPDFTITALDPVNDNVLYTLERFAQRLSAERAVTLRLTQQSVYAAQRQGWDASRIQTYLEQLTGQPLPGNVARSLQDWQEWHERISIQPGLTLVHAADPRELEELAEDPKLKEFFAFQPAPGLAVLPAALREPAPQISVPRVQSPGVTAPRLPAQHTHTILSVSPAPQPVSPILHQLVNLLLERYWVPVVVNQPEALPAGAVSAAASGRLQFLRQPASIYLRAHLASLADAQEDGAYILTRGSIQRAVRSGMSAPEIIQELNRVLADPLSYALEKQITAWSGHFGSARLEASVLLHFKDENTQKELLADPELAPYLRTLKPSEVHTTVAVDTADLERVVRMLEERGVEIKRR